MGIFINYRSNPFASLAQTPTLLLSAYKNVTWITSLIICNKGAAPIRFNMQKVRASGTELEKDCIAGSTINIDAIYNNNISGVGASLTNNGALSVFAVDGITPAINSRILIKDQTDTFQNGIYKLSVVGDVSTAWVLVRTLDYDSINEINNGDVVTVTTGTVNAVTRWRQNSDVTVIGTSPITFITEPVTSYFHFNQKEIHPYETVDIIKTSGVITLEFGTKPFVSDSLVCFSNGYTQVFDCDVIYAQLNELPMT
jgi:hypothetical protein